MSIMFASVFEQINVVLGQDFIYIKLCDFRYFRRLQIAAFVPYDFNFIISGLDRVEIF